MIAKEMSLGSGRAKDDGNFHLFPSETAPSAACVMATGSGEQGGVNASQF